MSEIYGQHLQAQISLLSPEPIIDSKELVAAYLRTLVDRIDMNILAGPLVTYADGPPEKRGCSGIILLWESHAAIHTYTDLRTIFLDVFSCRPFEAAQVFAVLTEFFGAHIVNEQRISERGHHWNTHIAKELQRWAGER